MKVELKCDYCGSIFTREARELKRSQKRGRRNFCSRSCCGKIAIKNIPENSKNKNIKKFCANRADKYTGFREHLRRALTRDQVVDISLDDLLEVWNKQEGICPYTGTKLSKPHAGSNCRISTASLDRIDSRIGYVKDNLQFVAMPINFMKNSLSHDQTVDFCKKIALFWLDKVEN